MIDLKYMEYEENGIYLVFGVTDDGRVKLLHFASIPFDASRLCRPRDTWRESQIERRDQMIDESFQLVQIDISGYDRPYENHGRKYVGTAPGYFLRLDHIDDSRNEFGRKIVIFQKDPENTIEVESHFQFYDSIRVVRCFNRVTNISGSVQTLEYLSSFSYTGLEKEADGDQEKSIRVSIPRNAWMKELDWTSMTLEEAGFDLSQPSIERKTSWLLEATNTGNWSTKKYLPMGYLENSSAHTSLFWQIDHSGSWHWEIGDHFEHYYLSVSGPTERESHWFRDLKPGESFMSVPAAVGAAQDDFDAAMGELTKYRRRIRRPNRDDEKLSVIFNDYMNCLFGDPTEERELPMIEAAAQCGCEYYVIDAGWYADGPWWDGVGEWKESRKRFPNGLKNLTDHIRAKGMIPGLWLELEVMGIRCPLADKVPDDWFFVRHGKRVYDRSRYQLDFRNPEVRKFATDTIRRLVEEYGAGYIKMDYNIEPGIGTEISADSPGQGLLDHERAFLGWLDEVYQTWPDLVIENCSSGGLRMDYGMLSRHSIQSMSDQENFLQFAVIAANAVTGAAPEQAAIWSYPLENADEEEVIFNMVNAMLLRIHQSGHLVRLAGTRRGLVEEGIRVYKRIRGDIKDALPFWPLGLAGYEDHWLAAGLKLEKRAYLAVWKRGEGDDSITIDLGRSLGGKNGEAGKEAVKREMKVTCIYPEEARDASMNFDPNVARSASMNFDPDSASLKVTFPGPYMARLYEIRF